MSPADEQGQGDGSHRLEKEEPAFPHADLAKLDDMINRYFSDVVFLFYFLGAAYIMTASTSVPNCWLSKQFLNYNLELLLFPHLCHILFYYSPSCNIIRPPGVAVNAEDEALKLKQNRL